VVILDQGQMLASDTVAELLSRTPSGVFLKVDDVTKLNGHLDGLATTSVNDGQQLVFVSGDVAEVDQRLPLVLEELRKASVQVQHIETQHPNLEHLFLQMTGRQLRD
jgi:ABC-type multidrug transport system ATPase subunit